MKTAAVILAAGQGKRMHSQIQKQYMTLGGNSLISYSLTAFERSKIDQVVLVVEPGKVAWCKKQIVEPYGFSKVTHIVEGGKERYDSVYEGLKALEGCDYVLIHDGARPFVNREIIDRALLGAMEYKACVIGMPSKDTIKLADFEGFAKETPVRNQCWTVQTPQAFSYGLIREAYDKLYKENDSPQSMGITDDAMVVEAMTQKKVKLIEGDYSNIKITTPEDMVIAEALLRWKLVK